MKLMYQIRPATSQDESLILSSWLKGAYHLCPAFKDMPKSLYFGLHEPAVKLSLATSKALCAVDSEDPTHVLGYVVFKNYPGFSVLHWVYTKHQFRGFSIGKNLIKEANLQPIVFTSSETLESQKYLNKLNIRSFHVPHFRHGEWHEAQISVFLSSR
jgi:hypothetical protein